MKAKKIQQIVYLCTFVLWNSLIFGQKNFVPASIIMNDGTNIMGSIQELEENRYYSNITTKLPNTNEIKKIDIEKIKQIQLKELGQVYDCVEVEILSITQKENDLPIITNPIDYANNLKSIAKVMLLKKLRSGKINFYETYDEYNQVHFYIQKNDEKLIELRKVKYKIMRANSVYVSSIDTYREQLSNIFADSPQDFMLGKLKFLKDEILNKIDFYNQSMGYSISKLPNSVKKTQSSIEGAFMLGASKTSVNVPVTQRFSSSILSSVLGEMTFSESINPIIGFNILFSPKRNKPLSIMIDMMYTGFKSEGFFSENDGVIMRNYKANMSFNYLQGALSLRYHIPMNKVKIFVNAGVSSNQLISHETSIKITKKIIPTSLVENTEYKLVEDSNLSRNSFGWLTGIGCNIRRISIELRLSKNQGFADSFMQFQTQPTSLSAILSYKIF